MQASGEEVIGGINWQVAMMSQRYDLPVTQQAVIAVPAAAATVPAKYK